MHKRFARQRHRSAGRGHRHRHADRHAFFLGHVDIPVAGKHVLVEKPLARSVAEAEELVALAERKKRLLAVGHVFLFNNGIRAVKDLIDRGELGAIRYIFSSRTNLGPFRSDVNALWDLGSHDVSIFNYWLDAEPQQVTACGTSYLNPNVEDVVVANFAYPNQVQACVHASWLNPQKVREITVVGERQMVVWNDMDLNEPVRVYHKSVDVERGAEYADSFGAFRLLVRSGDVVIPQIDPAGAATPTPSVSTSWIASRTTPNRLTTAGSALRESAGA